MRMDQSRVFHRYVIDDIEHANLAYEENSEIAVEPRYQEFGVGDFAIHADEDNIDSGYV